MSGVDSERVRALNDAFRTAGPFAGTWVITAGVQALGSGLVLEAVRKVQAFDTFTEDNDPYGEHDFGSFEMAGEILFWKIDYYAPDLAAGSDNPADPDTTRRVLTLMLASDY